MPPARRSKLAYEDCRLFLDRAMEEDHGAEARFIKRSDAIVFSHRCNRFRVLDREESKRIYEPMEAKYGSTPYDLLIIRPVEREGFWYVQAQKRNMMPMVITALDIDAGTTPETISSTRKISD